MRYDNTPTVVAVLVPSPIEGHLVVIRRGNEPGKGLLGLPGGYHMKGESWQEAGCREVLEETGYVLEPSRLKMLSMVTDEYDNNLVIAQAEAPIREIEVRDDAETLAVLHISTADSKEFAFPRHFAAALRYLTKD